MKILKKWWIWIIFGIVILTAGIFFTKFLPIGYFLPHDKPVIILPIEAKYDSLCGIMPMGEKIEHPNTPSGHPGIDFGFGNISENIPYIASMDGVIRKVEIYDAMDEGAKDKISLSPKRADVVIKNGLYQIVYRELDGNSLPENIKEGVRIKQGEIVGYGNFHKITRDGLNLRGEMIHWEFGSGSPFIDRFCPLTYFTEESRSRIETIWDKTQTPDMKAQYPKICNGDYDGKVG